MKMRMRGLMCAHVAVIDGKRNYSLKADIYSLGIVLWELMTKSDVFPDLEDDEVMYAIQQGDRPEIPTFVPPEFANLIRACWAEDPLSRPAASVVLESLEHLLRTLRSGSS
jgi:serine/threonine protein kinase